MKSLTDQNYARAAKQLGCEEAIRAVAEVESSGSGFLPDGRFKVLFEGHIFFRETDGRYAESHPTLCFPRWTRKHYARGETADERNAGEIARLGRLGDLGATTSIVAVSTPIVAVDGNMDAGGPARLQGFGPHS